MVNRIDGTTPESEVIDLLGDGQELESELTETDELADALDDGETEGEETEADADQEEAAEEDDEDSEAEADEGTERHTVKVDGEEQTVTLQQLKDGFMKDADYRRKTASLAEDRKRIEAKEQQYDGTLGTYVEKLELVEAFLVKQAGLDDAALDRLAEENPAEYVRAQRELVKRESALASVRGELEDARKQQSGKQSEGLKAWREAEAQRLIDAAPEFRNPENVSRLHTYLKDAYGLTKEQVDSVADHRFTVIAEKARKYDVMKTKAALKDKQVQKVAKVQKGGASNRLNEQARIGKRAFETVMSSGNVKDLSRLL